VLLAIAVLGAGRDGLPLFRLTQEHGWEPWRDLKITRSMLPLSPAQRDYIGPGYARDRDYAVFLWNVQRNLPEARRIFLLVQDQGQDQNDWYRYRAAYRLAPTPVEQFDRLREPAAGDLLMTWRVPPPSGWTVFFRAGDGALARRGDAP
jgi:hypothetical protein